MDSVTCVGCGTHFHPNCSSKAGAIGPDGVILCCGQAQPTAEADLLYGRLQRLFQEQFDGFKRDIEERYLSQILDLKREMKVMSAKLANQEKQISVLQQTVAGLESATRPSEGASAVYTAEEFYSELDDRKTRAKNVMFYGVSVTGPAREDNKLVQDIVSKVFPEIKVVRATRVGGSRDDGLLSIKVSLRDSEDALKILRGKSRFEPVRVKADLTLKQREHLSRLRQELESRKSRGEQDITIRYIRGNPKIVSLSKNHRKPTGAQRGQSDL